MTATKELKTTNGQSEERHRPHEQLPSIAPPRLPYHPAIEQRFGVDKASWKALVEAIFPNATSTESVILALSYCRARKLDPFKRNVHIVPIWNKELRRYIDTIWPGIGELRTTAFRTGEYAGRDDATLGPDETKVFAGVAGSRDSKRDVTKSVTFPQWAQVTVYRLVKGNRVAFAGPRVYWLETYATLGHDNDIPNEMWETRPRGQLEKCAEAAALRAAFPEEVGCDYIPEEVQGGRPATFDSQPKEQTQTLTALTDQLLGANMEMPPDQTPDNDENPDLIAGVDVDLPDAEGVSDCEAIKAKWLKHATTEADRTAVVARCDARAEEIRASRGSRSNKEAATA